MARFSIPLQLDAQELGLQEREAMMARHNREVAHADRELTKLCAELDRNKEKLRAQGQSGHILAKLNW